jgi:hypothetical protein
MTQEYPLAWPEGWPRATSRKRGAFSTGGKSITFFRAEARAHEELKRLVDAETVVISSNVIRDREPADPGVAMYWREKESGADRVIAIDIYNRAADNLAAIAATIEAMRAIDRHGGATILNRAFTGFTALPPPADCWKELGLGRGASKEAIEAAWKNKVRDCRRTHPQGDHPSEGAINAARGECLRLAKS